MRHFCTYFDHNYLTRGLALYRSLERFAGDFVLHILCLDDTTYRIVTQMGLSRVRVISLGELEAGDPELSAARGSRSWIEYYFTCTPSLILYVLRRVEEGELVAYADADLFFFSSPAPITHELADRSVLIIEHRFSIHLRDRLKWGIYNVGLVVFRKDRFGLECVEWWRARCLEWCFDRLENGKFADQKYLDDWPLRFAGVHVLQHPGAGVAPWNIGRYRFTRRGGHVLVSGEPLIFFHFHRLRIVSRFLFDPRLEEYGESLTGLLASDVYLPYARALQSGMRTTARTVAGTTSATPRELVDMLLLRTALVVLGPLWFAPRLGRVTRPIRNRVTLPAPAAIVGRNTRA